jgi:hypothetical protein
MKNLRLILSASLLNVYGDSHLLTICQTACCYLLSSKLTVFNKNAQGYSIRISFPLNIWETVIIPFRQFIFFVCLRHGLTLWSRLTLELLISCFILPVSWDYGCVQHVWFEMGIFLCFIFCFWHNV